MFNTGEIIWARVPGFPWWPAYIISPTAAQLKRLSIQKIPPDQRLVCFFNDNDRYQLLNVDNLRRFRDHQYTPQPKSKKPKLAAQLKLAFEQASQQYQRPNNLEDEEPLDALVIPPLNATQPQSSSAKQPRKTKKRKIPDLTASPDLEQLALKQFDNRKTPQTIILTKKSQPAARTSGDVESDRLSTHCNPSPCDRSSQETGIDSRPNMAAAKHTPPRKILLHLRIRERRTFADEEKRIDSPRPDSSLPRRSLIETRGRTTSSGGQLRKKEQKNSLTSREHSTNQSARKRRDDSAEDDGMLVEKGGTVHIGRNKKRKGSDLAPKLRRGAQRSGEDTAKRRRLTATEGAVEGKKPRLSEVRVLTYPVDIADVANDGEKVEVSLKRRPTPEPQPSNEVTKVIEYERATRSDAPIRRSRRMRRASSRMAGTDEGLDRESEDDAQRPVASKRSRGLEAPRMSDGQRRFHIRQERNEKSHEDVEGKRENGKRANRRAEHLYEDNTSDSGLDEATKSFEDLTKDECLKVIYKLRATLRRKSVQLWLRGRKLVEARDVLRTEESLIKVCAPRVEKAERLLKWVKKQESFDKGEGSRFANLETIAFEECESLVDVYFDRRRVSLKKIGPRILKLTKELAPHSSKVTEVLLDLLLLWLDLTGSSKKLTGIKTK